MKTVIYKSDKHLDCECDAEIIICLSASLTAANLPYIAGTLTHTATSGISVCGNQIYSYYLNYDENLLLNPAYSLVASDITGILCKGCLTSWIESFVNSETCYSCENVPLCVHPFIYPECYGALGNGLRDDSGSINSAITAAQGQGGGIILFSSGKVYKVESPIVIPITADNITLSGYGATIRGALDDSIIRIADIVTQNDHATNINILGLSVFGSGNTDTTFPNQNGIEINAIIGCTLRDVQIWNIPNVGLIGTKSGASGATYWNQVLWDHVSVRFCGKQCVSVGAIGNNAAGDDLTIINSLFNHGGEKISSNDPDGAVYLKVIGLSMSGCEISGNYSIANPGFGYRRGLIIQTACGLLSDMHYEGNGNNQAGSADLLIEDAARGLVVSGSNHYGSLTVAPKYAIEVVSAGASITGVTWAGDVGIHNYDYIINGIGATDLYVGNIQNLNNPQIAPNVKVVNYNYALYGSTNFVAHDHYVRTGRRIETFQSRYLSADPPEIVLGAGWGDQASVVSVSAQDSHGDFTIMAAGAGFAIPATIDITFADGPYANQPTLIFYQRNHNASDAQIGDLVVNPYDHGFNVTNTDTLPISGRTYTFSWMLVGNE